MKVKLSSLVELKVHNQLSFQFYFVSFQEYIYTLLFYCNITGIPKPPGNIELTLINNGQDLLVTWNSESSKLQPISQYRVSVRSTNVDTKSNIRSRRQSEPELQEYVTTEERFLLEKVENEKTYTIQVCAENDFGHACADSNEFTIRGKEGEPRMVVLISDGLEPSDDAESATIATLSQGYVIAIILLPLILLLVVCILVISVIIYSCCRYNSKHYYPSQQGRNNYPGQLFRGGGARGHLPPPPPPPVCQ